MYRKEKRIPTLLALFLIFAGIGTAVYLDNKNSPTSLQAEQSVAPVEIHFTNISETSFTVSWLTEKQALGFVEVNSNNSKKTYFDQEDSDNVPKARLNHYVRVDNLTENTEYEVLIKSGNNCPNNIICPVVKQKTAVRLDSTLNLPPVHGSMIKDNNSPLEKTVVYVTVGKNATLSGRTDSAGLYVIPLSNLRTQDLSKRPILSDTDIVQINVLLSTSKKANAVIDVKSIRQNLTIPAMKTGNSYNFVYLIAKKDLLAKALNQNILGTETTSKNIINENINPVILDKSEIQILFPKKDLDTTPDLKPRLRGVAIPGSKLLIIVKSTPQVDQIVTGKDGTWTWRPSKSLEPGTHQITIQGYDNKGNLITQTRKFIVLKSGEQVLGESTPSASLTPFPTEIVSPTAKFSPTTAVISPTIPGQLTATPTVRLSPTIFYPSATPITSDTPKTGTTAPTYIILGSSIVLLLVGLKFLIL